MKISSSAENYAWRQLATRAGLAVSKDEGTGFEDAGISVFYGQPQERISTSPALIISRASESDWSALLRMEKNSLRRMSAQETVPAGAKLPFENSVPVLFWGQGIEKDQKPFAEIQPDGALVIYADLLASTLFMLTRWEEIVQPERDSHARFPSAKSAAVQQGFLDIPLIDQYALILREWLKVLLPEYPFKKHVFQVKITHDIDKVRRYADLPSFVWQVGQGLVKKPALSKLAFQFSTLRTQMLSPQSDVFYRSIYQFAEMSKRFGIASSFFFMAADRNKYQQGYDPASALVKRCLTDLKQQGHEIGFHPGYYTLNNPAQLAKEKQRLESALGSPVTGGRQHYLRFQASTTWRDWEQAGLTYDSTLAYAEYEGFRCGTCHPYRPFDIEQDRELNLTEYPLIVMDSTLFNYRQLTPEEGTVRTLQMAGRCAEVGGTFTLLWHNSSLEGEWEAWGKAYTEILTSLAEKI